MMLEGRRVAIVAAHPDDETIGVGGSLCLLPAPVFIHVTDGAPRDMLDAVANGFSTREEYAAARRHEFRDALRAGGITPAETISLGYADQEASLHLVELTSEIASVLQRIEIDLVLVHPYEGGHPDHDAAAFAVRAAWNLSACNLEDHRRAEIAEFTSYHNSGGNLESGVFLPESRVAETVVALDGEARARKQRMLACYRTQQGVLRNFRIGHERFRLAPDYDFTAPPHRGRLYYEQFPWGITGERWRTMARSASDVLGL
jgi:LmbE family N-acetylglucosaminyl deacetylase